MIGIFVNTKSGKGMSLFVAAQIEDILYIKHIPYIVFRDDWPIGIEQLTEAWIVGGDGTLNYFINTYSTLTIPLSVFKGGTGNDFAWTLYRDMDTKQQIEYLLYSTVKKVDAGVCNGKLFINSVGIGFDGEVLKSMGTIRWLGGHLGYLWIVLKKIFSFKEFIFDIESDGLKIKKKYLLVNIANAGRTGGGFHVSPLAKIDDGQLNIVLCDPLSKVKRLRYLPLIEKGKHLSLPVVTHHLTNKVKITLPGSAFAQLDGELIEADCFILSILKHQFNFKY